MDRRVITLILLAAIALSSVSGLCELTGTDDKATQPIYDLDKQFNKIDPKSLGASTRPLFHPSVTELCPQIDPTLAGPSTSSATLSGAFLGQGNFSRVFKVSASHKQDQAVKLIKVKEAFANYMEEVFEKNTEFTSACRNALVNALGNKQLFAGTRTVIVGGKHKTIANEINSIGSQLTALTPKDPQVLTVGECQLYPEQVAKVTAFLEITLSHLRREIEVLDSFFNKKDLGAMSQVFKQSYKGCAVDRDLNVFVRTDVFGHSWKDLHEVCPLIGAPSLADRLKFYFKFLYQVHKLHRIGYVHCDLKEENVVFAKNRYDAFTLIDFGVANNVACRGGTPAKAPPEFMVFKGDFPEKGVDGFGASHAQKHDAFSAGMLLAGMEVSNQKAEALADDYFSIYTTFGPDYEAYLKHDKSFREHVSNAIKLAMAQRLKQTNTSALEETVGPIFVQLIAQMLAFDYKARLPVSAALFQLFTLYKALVDPNSNSISSKPNVFTDHEYFVQQFKDSNNWKKIDALAHEFFAEEHARSLVGNEGKGRLI